MEVIVFGRKMFYEREGLGPPLILWHGNGESHLIFAEAIKKLSQNFTVYAPDARGHGQSQSTEEFHYQDFADDLVEFMRVLKLDRPLFYGFSDGGIVGLLACVEHANLFEKMIISGANTKPQGLKSIWLNWFKLQYFFKKNALMRLMLTEPNLTKNELRKIKVPTMVIAGEWDIVRLSDTQFIAENIQDSVLEILKGEDHASYVLDSEKLVTLLEKYFL